MRLVNLCLMGLAALVTAWVTPVLAAEPLVVGTSNDLVKVTSHFTGRELLVYGALSQPGQVIVLLRSPAATEAMSRKTRTGPIWLTGARVTVTGAPGIWEMLSSAPADQLLPLATRQLLGLDPGHLSRQASYQPEPADVAAWQQAFLKNKLRRRDYVVQSQGVHIEGGQLFSARMALPASLPLGRYTLDAFLVRHGQVVARQEQHIEVQQTGFQAWIARFASQDGWLYGIVLTLTLAAMGLGLGIVMQRRLN